MEIKFWKLKKNLNLFFSLVEFATFSQIQCTKVQALAAHQG
jgi:hypothetical protein